jgi:hypothetical protein
MAECGPGFNGTTRAATAMRDYADRLDFRLPPFLRMSWAAAAARDRWSDPLNRFVEEIRASEWLSVATGVRPAAIVVVSQTQASTLANEWLSRGLRSCILGPDDASRLRLFNGKTPHINTTDAVHLVTRSGRLEELEAVWRAADLLQIATWLGYPPCCAAFLQEMAGERQYLDITWGMVEGDTYEESGAQIAEVEGHAVNPLLTALGLRTAPHRPCSFHCKETQRLATTYDSLRAEINPRLDKDKLADVMAWPVEWSSFHGIVEVRLPVLKFCYEGDATATAYKVRLTGGTMPEHAAQGLEFPNRPPQRRRIITQAELR